MHKCLPDGKLIGEKMKYSIVIPCYKSAATIAKVVELTINELKAQNINNYEFVLVNDASPDGGMTIKELKMLSQKYDFVKAVDLAKNAGQHNAILAALNCADGDAFIAMDDDMQTHPSQLKYLINEFQNGYDIVYGYYPEKKHSFVRNLASKLNYWSVRVLIGKPKELKTSSFWIIRRYVRDRVIEYNSSYTYLQGLFLRTTRNISCIPIKHFEREVGTSGYTFKSLLKLWSSILGFSVIPLRIAMVVGIFLSLLGGIGGIYVIIHKILFSSIAMGNWGILYAMCFMTGVILFFMGLIGEYIGRLSMTVSKEPQYVIREVYTKEKK